MSGKQATTDKTFLNSQHWCRLTVCLNNPLKDALIAILHNTIKDPNINALPSDPTQLYNFMVNNKNKLMKLKKSRVLKQDQLDHLLPQEGKVFSDKLDITLLRLLIQTFSGIVNEDGHWREPRHDDHSIAAAVFRAVNIRNKVIHHAKPTSMSDQEFNDIWCQIENTLTELGYPDDISEYKTHDFDPILIKQLHSNMAEDFENILLAYKEKCKNKDVSTYFVERNYRNTSTWEEVSNIDELLKDHDSIMVSGEAGLGKTFSAKKMRYLWGSGEILKEKKLLYIDSKRVNRQMYKPSYAAPICVSELGDVLEDKSDEYLESFGCVKKTIKDLVVIIDGVDELSMKKNNLDLDFLKTLQVKIDKNNEISAMETIIGIYFGLFFPGSKIIAFGRKNEVERLQGIHDQLQKSNLFNKQTRAVLDLLPLNDNGMKELISRASCNMSSCSCEKCVHTYSLVEYVAFGNVPSHLMALIRIFKYLPNTNFGRITKTKIFIITMFNLLKNHTQTVALKDFKTFKRFFKCDKTIEFRECIQQIAKISFLALLKGNVTIKVEEHNENDVDYFKYNQIYQGDDICITIKRDILEQLDLFYVRDLEYNVILEPHHLTNMEFLASCYIYCYPNEWDLLLKLDEDRKTMVLSYVTGLHSKENFTKDFVSEVLHDNSNHDIQNYLSWLFSIEDVRNNLPRSKRYGSKENGQLYPPFELLNMMNEEVDLFDEISKELEEVQKVVYFDSSYDISTILFLDLLVDSFVGCETYEIVTNDNACSKNIEVMRYLPSNIHQLKSNSITLFQYKKKYSRFNKNIGVMRYLPPDIDQLKTNDIPLFKPQKVNSRFSISRGLKKCDSCTIDLLLNALLPSTTSSSSNTCSIDCKRLKIEDIENLNSEQTKTLFSIALSGFVDYISVDSNFSFFTCRQLKILRDVESKYTNKLMNIELRFVTLKRLFDLPNLGNRHIFLNCAFWSFDSNDVIKFKQHVLRGNSNNFSNYKIIDHKVPFVRKKIYTGEYEQSMYLVLNGVDFTLVPPEVFANTFSLIPSFACMDYGSLIPSSHWLRLSQIKDGQINEVRIWYPLSKNFQHFLNIKTNILQFICKNKNDLIELLDHIVKKENVQFDKEIKVFVVKYDEDDWDHYEEKTLFSEKTIEECKDNYCSDDFLLERNVKKWCCEISLSFLKKNGSVATFSGLETQV